MTSPSFGVPHDFGRDVFSREEMLWAHRASLEERDRAARADAHPQAPDLKQLRALQEHREFVDAYCTDLGALIAAVPDENAFLERIAVLDAMHSDELFMRRYGCPHADPMQAFREPPTGGLVRRAMPAAPPVGGGAALPMPPQNPFPGLGGAASHPASSSASAAAVAGGAPCARPGVPATGLEAYVAQLHRRHASLLLYRISLPGRTIGLTLVSD
eukprot:TRINITY_DN27065_c0_g1_i4.p1 TRINITY_DN27065_c0_g1~~TRINITY_DN27065_c0_g1_i4.p1  ORF type:complete len:236 (+),score=16.03 TRINITY_DN27065_c0_g1_i4:64-708(+)